MRSITLALIASLSLSACGSVVMTTAAMLGMTNPLEADPGNYEIAVDIPDGVDVAKDGVKFTFAAKNTVLNTDQSYVYALARRETMDGRSLFRFAETDLPEIRAFQATSKQREMDNPDANSGSISVMVSFCKIGDGPADDDTFSVAIRTKPGGRFTTLIRNARVKDAIDLIDDPRDPRNLAPLCQQ